MRQSKVRPIAVAVGYFRPHCARPAKISFAEMRDMGVRGLLVYCADYHCSHSIAISADAWPDEARLSDIEERFTCRVISIGIGCRSKRWATDER